VRDEKEYFDEIQDVKVTKDMLDLAKHIVTQKAKKPAKKAAKADRSTGRRKAG
jgi:non-homologous end joining protein Ku